MLSVMVIYTHRLDLYIYIYHIVKSILYLIIALYYIYWLILIGRCVVLHVILCIGVYNGCCIYDCIIINYIMCHMNCLTIISKTSVVRTLLYLNRYGHPNGRTAT